MTVPHEFLTSNKGWEYPETATHQRGMFGGIGARRSHETAEIPGLFHVISIPFRGANKTIIYAYILRLYGVISATGHCSIFVDGWATSQIRPLTSALTRWQLNRVIDLMRARLAEDISLGEIAAAANLSPSHFARSFRKATGISPHRFLVQLRLDKTRGLLRATKLAIVDISAEVGYPDPGYRARVFRKELGITPAAYRREHGA